MRTSCCTKNDLIRALGIVNKKYNNNIIFNRFEDKRFTLRVKDSKKEGARRSLTGRRMVSACWHVHGDFFDALFAVNPNAVVYSGGTHRITKDGGNWIDRNIGSVVAPMMFSEACECGV